MIYAISDIHGSYERYRKMLDLIDLREEDTLYVLGDCVDRGPGSAKVLQDMASRDNVIPLLGNHDRFAASFLRILCTEITEENALTHLDADFMRGLMDWQANGGDTTMKAFRALSRNEQKDLIDYLESFSLYEICEVNGRVFIMTHAGLGSEKARRLSSYSEEEMTMARSDPRTVFYDDPKIYTISGHTPTFFYNEEGSLDLTRTIFSEEKGEVSIRHFGRNYLIDCEACMEEGRLACLRLDDLKEFYIK